MQLIFHNFYLAFFQNFIESQGKRKSYNVAVVASY
jgi:hypothetical protein